MQLILAVYGEVLGVCFPNPRYTLRETVTEVYSQIALYAHRIQRKKALPGDLVVLAYQNTPSHLGILTEYGVIHAKIVPPKVVEHRLPKRCEDGFPVAFYRMRRRVAPSS